MVNFGDLGDFLKTCTLRSNSVARHVTFNKTKIVGKCQNKKNSNATIFDNFQTLWYSLQNYLSSFILEIHFIMATCVTQGNISWFSHVIFLMEFNHWWCFLFFLVNYNQNLDNLHKIQNNDDHHHHWTFPGFSNYQNRQKRICWMCWGAWGALKGRHPAFHSV